MIIHNVSYMYIFEELHQMKFKNIHVTYIMYNHSFNDGLEEVLIIPRIPVIIYFY